MIGIPFASKKAQGIYMNSSKKIIGSLAVMFFVVTGTYNAVVINSESHISGSEIQFVKRLDEIYGVHVPGRVVAASTTWKKIEPGTVIVNNHQIVQPVSTSASAPAVTESNPAEPVAAVQEELTLSLVEVINPVKYQKGLTQNEFNGSLSTNNGVIENLSVSLPNGEGVSVSFSEMSGNVFEYDLNGDLYSGMMYQIDQSSYMVTLTNGPLEGTRLRFSSGDLTTQQQDNQQVLAEQNVETGTFGSAPVDPATLVENDQKMQEEAMQAQSFNLSNTEAL